MSEPTNWHRLFGLSWMDFFRGLPVTVEVEKDLSIKQQLLDVVVVRKEAGPLPVRLPDGFEELATHNLITFKSYQEALDGWALHELIGHYVNYRKQASPTMQELLPETDFRLFAVCVRVPQGLAKTVPLKPVQPGVYDVAHFTGALRVIVVHELPRAEHNAMMHLFSARTELVQYGRDHYRLRWKDSTGLLVQLFTGYRLEASTMPDMLEQFAENAIKELLKNMPTEQRIEGIAPDELLKLVPPSQRLRGLSVDEIRKNIPADKFIEGLTADELLAALSPEMKAAVVQRLTSASSERTPPKPDTSNP